MAKYRVTRDNNRNTGGTEYYVAGDIVEVEGGYPHPDADNEVYTTTRSTLIPGRSYGWIAADALELYAPVDLDVKMLNAALALENVRSITAGQFLSVFDTYNKIKEALA